MCKFVPLLSCSCPMFPVYFLRLFPPFQRSVTRNRKPVTPGNACARPGAVMPSAAAPPGVARSCLAAFSFARRPGVSIAPQCSRPSSPPVPAHKKRRCPKAPPFWTRYLSVGPPRIGSIPPESVAAQWFLPSVLAFSRLIPYCQISCLPTALVFSSLAPL